MLLFVPIMKFMLKKFPCKVKCNKGGESCIKVKTDK